jgi:hypothetical protein
MRFLQSNESISYLRLVMRYFRGALDEPLRIRETSNTVGFASPGLQWLPGSSTRRLGVPLTHEFATFSLADAETLTQFAVK